MNKIDTAVILAGGKSSRMGFDKRLITIENKLLIEILVDSLKDIFSNIIIVSNDKTIEFAPEIMIVEDTYKNIGPLGGIHAGLLHSSSDYSYFIACDMPYINKEYINYMKGKLHITSTDGLITRYKEHLEPFNSFYAKSFINKIEKHITNGEKSIYSLINKSDVIYIEEKVAREYSPNWKMFYNINTVEDLSQLEKI